MLCTRNIENSPDPTQAINELVRREMAALPGRIVRANFQMLKEEFERNPLSVLFPWTPTKVLELWSFWLRIPRFR